MYHQSIIYCVIPTPYIKHVPVVPLVTEQQYFINTPLYSSSPLITKNSKVHNPKSHTKMQLKEKYWIPSSQEISISLVSTEVYTTIQNEEKLAKHY